VEWHGMISAQQSGHSMLSLSHDFETISPRLQAQAEGQEVLGIMTDDGDIIKNPWLGSRPISAQMSDYSSLHLSEDGNDHAPMHFEPDHREYSSKRPRQETSHAEYEGIEGIYRFIEHCDRARR